MKAGEVVVQISYLHDQGLKKAQIARRLIDRGTVSKYLKEPAGAGKGTKAKARAKKARTKKIDSFLALYATTVERLAGTDS